MRCLVFKTSKLHQSELKYRVQTTQYFCLLRPCHYAILISKFLSGTRNTLLPDQSSLAVFNDMQNVSEMPDLASEFRKQER